MTRRLGRFEGRLFAEGGCLFMVVGVNDAGSTARVSCRVDGQTQIIEMPLAEVAKRVSSGASLVLDNLNGPESARRILEQKDGWYFAAREGQMGPFASQELARRELVRYVLKMQTSEMQTSEVQTSGETRREPLRSAGQRRRDRVLASQPA